MQGLKYFVQSVRDFCFAYGFDFDMENIKGDESHRYYESDFTILLNKSTNVWSFLDSDVVDDDGMVIVGDGESLEEAYQDFEAQI